VKATPAFWFVLPGDPASRTGGYLYDARIRAGLADLGLPSTLVRLPATFPRPTAEDETAAAEALSAIPDGARVVVDGLAFAYPPALLAALAARCRLLALVHHALPLETGLPPETAEHLRRHEATALAAARRVVVTAPPTARSLVQLYGLAAGRIAAVLPGTEPATAAPLAAVRPHRLLTVATVTPRKGHRLLVEALAPLRDRPWHLTCVGSLGRDPACLASVQEVIGRLHLQDRVDLLDEVEQDQLDAIYRDADLFVLPSFLEGYGMAIAEALARGLPVITTDRAAIVETLTSPGLIAVPAGDRERLTTALERLLDGAEAYAAAKAGARECRRALPSWAESAKAFAEELAAL